MYIEKNSQNSGQLVFQVSCVFSLIVFISSPAPPSLPLSLSPSFQLSSRAVKDYNRGRAYLGSIARKRSVPLYTSTVDAALHVVYIVKGYDVPPNSTDHHVPLQGTSV